MVHCYKHLSWDCLFLLYMRSFSSFIYPANNLFLLKFLASSSLNIYFYSTFCHLKGLFYFLQIYLVVMQFYVHSGQSSAKIEELLQEDQNVKRRRERYTKQSTILSKLVRQLSIHDNRADAASDGGNGPGNFHLPVHYSITEISNILCLPSYLFEY